MVQFPFFLSKNLFQGPGGFHEKTHLKIGVLVVDDLEPVFKLLGPKHWSNLPPTKIPISELKNYKTMLSKNIST